MFQRTRIAMKLDIGKEYLVRTPRRVGNEYKIVILVAFTSHPAYVFVRDQAGIVERCFRDYLLEHPNTEANSPRILVS